MDQNNFGALRQATQQGTEIQIGAGDSVIGLSGRRCTKGPAVFVSLLHTTLRRTSLRVIRKTRENLDPRVTAREIFSSLRTNFAPVSDSSNRSKQWERLLRCVSGCNQHKPRDYIRQLSFIPTAKAHSILLATISDSSSRRVFYRHGSDPVPSSVGMRQGIEERNVMHRPRAPPGESAGTVIGSSLPCRRGDEMSMP